MASSISALLTNLFLPQFTSRSMSIGSKVVNFFKYELSYADLYLVPMFADNYGYILVDRKSNLSLLVDPADSTSIISALKNLGILDTTKLLLCTHKHNDHAGGNLAIKQLIPDIDIVATKYEDIPGRCTPAGEDDKFQLGYLNIQTLYTPCHTRGHVCFLITNNSPEECEGTFNSPPILFCGDTLFVGGCGRFFEGVASDMLTNMNRLNLLPDDTLVCCAHEYTLSNFKFLSSVDSELVETKYESLKSQRERMFPTVPSTIGEEKKYNLFMRCNELKTQQLIGCSDAETTMAKLREMKNNF